MFENMGDAARVGRRRAKGDAEDLVLVVVDEREQFSARLGVPVQSPHGIDFGENLLAQQFKSKDEIHPTFLKQLGEARAQISGRLQTDWPSGPAASMLWHRFRP